MVMVCMCVLTDGDGVYVHMRVRLSFKFFHKGAKILSFLGGQNSRHPFLRGKIFLKGEGANGRGQMGGGKCPYPGPPPPEKNPVCAH